MAEPRLHKRIKRLVRFYLLSALFLAIGLLPLSVAKGLGAIIGRLAFGLAGREKQKTLRSLKLAFPEKSDQERLAIAQQTFRHLGVCAGELCCIKRIDRQMPRYVEFPDADRQLLEDAVKPGRGVVFVTGHVGNFELMARRIAMAGFPSQTIAKETSDWRMTELMERFRASGRVRCIWRGKDGAAREMLRALKKGELLGMLIDQDTKVQGVFVDFFGEKAFTPRGAADLALRMQAAVVTGFIFRRPDGGHRVSLARVELPNTGDNLEDVRQLTQTLTLAIENAIRQVPHAWVWMHQRWKTRPTSSDNDPKVDQS